VKAFRKVIKKFFVVQLNFLFFVSLLCSIATALIFNMGRLFGGVPPCAVVPLPCNV
jgi:hypothetical protein